MENILITGITGFVGAHLANYLSTNPDNVIYGLHRSIKDESTFVALDLQNKNNINLILGDVNQPTLLQEIINDYSIDKIYHLAAQAIVSNANITPTPTYVTNIFGTMNILEATRIISLQTNKKIPTLVMSSDKSYGTSKTLPYTEDLPLNGLDIYSSSKACEDIVARAYAYNYDMPIVVARPCNIYGSFDFNWSRVIPQFIKAYLTDRKITIYTNTSKQLREYIHVTDLTKALETLISDKYIQSTKGKAFNITSHDLHNVDQILDTFKKVTNYHNIEFVNKDKGFKEINEQYLNGQKMYKTTNWKSSINLNDESFKHIVEDYEIWFEKSKFLSN